MGAQIDLECVDKTCDQVMGFDQLVANARTVREVFRIAMRCADALAKHFDEDQRTMRDAIILTDYTPKFRRFTITLNSIYPGAYISAHFRRGEGRWEIRGPLIIQNFSTLKPRKKKSERLEWKTTAFYHMGQSSTRPLPEAIADAARFSLAQKRREERLSRRRARRHSREEQKVA